MVGKENLLSEAETSDEVRDNISLRSLSPIILFNFDNLPPQDMPVFKLSCLNNPLLDKALHLYN